MSFSTCCRTSWSLMRQLKTTMSLSRMFFFFVFFTDYPVKSKILTRNLFSLSINTSWLWVQQICHSSIYMRVRVRSQHWPCVACFQGRSLLIGWLSSQQSTTHYLHSFDSLERLCLYYYLYLCLTVRQNNIIKDGGLRILSEVMTVCDKNTMIFNLWNTVVCPFLSKFSLIVFSNLQ